ncbi:DUF599 domain-containing protein [Pseudodesulfovibrio sediminis]|uniref:DUF599 domain-containing protein n=1 Tax=Pseudodesulfovibrio sediminis TaxID=2810563 RepID=A0ABM7P5A9_9BACT|nr:DUF599 domain-containing protein [Pseudodesulfovibrio sediminis]BCS88084.1 hypothetical protein PSDVSF_13260 [Pseudodesulfovibrio sediminis]
MNELIAPHFLDILCLAISTGLFTFYHLYVWWKLKTNPIYTLYGATKLAKTAWVVNVMEEKNDLLAVQTLRNSTMAATFLASTSILLAVGLLTLSGQGDELGQTWHAVNMFGSTAQSTMTFKLLVILANLFIAFFNFSFSIRLFSHVGFIINTPPEGGNYGTSFTFVAMQLNKAGSYFHIGMRAYYFLIPLIFWLFGPLLLVFSTIIVVVLISRIERTPKMDCGYLSAFFKKSCTLPPE